MNNLKKSFISLLFLYSFFNGYSQNFDLEDAPVLIGGKNQLSSISYNLNGVTLGKEKQYFNSLGKNMQQLSWDVLSGKVWASHTLYDRFGRGIFNTLSAPVNGGLFYSTHFILDNTGNSYGTNDFDSTTTVENPNPVSSNSELGSYYSINNTGNPYQDITQYPFTRTIFSRLNPGNPLKTIGGNKIDGQWKQSYSFTMPAGTSLSCTQAFGTNFNLNTKVNKTVSRDVNGQDVVVFTNSDGNTLATARSGDVQSACTTHLTINEQGYIDIHIPKGVTSFSIQNTDTSISGNLLVYNLITEIQIASVSQPNTVLNVSDGFYRISVSNPLHYKQALQNQQNPLTPIHITHQVTYYDYSLNFYDKTGRLTQSTQPKSATLTSNFTYNTLGQLLTADSPDEGLSKFLYRKDGQIRFSQNALQDKNRTFSYTHYDNLGRPIESGEYRGNILFDNAETLVDVPDGLDDTDCYEVVHTLYDLPDPNMATTLQEGKSCSFPALNYIQHFVAGNVSKTYTSNPKTATTWYSYDALGRVEWIIQKIEGLGCYKTIDYTYDPVNGQVSQVEYQRNNADERFIHRYQYNLAGQLTRVLTSRTANDNDFVEQARYYYAESGELIRTVLAENLQGIDYIYNLNGQLKAINHPSLNPINDPGRDGDPSTGSTVAADVFGFAIDYYNGDYLRNNTPTPVAQINTNGTDQYNGNIKAVRFNTQGLPNPINGNSFHTYLYQYNKNNWLKQALYGQGNIQAATGGNYLVNFTENPQEDYKVSNFTYDANGNILSLKRNGYTDANGTNAMDDFTYQYNSANQLQTVNDSGDNPNQERYNDLKDQSNNGSPNYSYNLIGQLTQDIQGKMFYQYTVSGLVKRISTFSPNGNGTPFQYYSQSFSNATQQEANLWTSSPGATATINYAGTYTAEPLGNACQYLGNHYQQSLQAILPHNGYVRRTYDVVSGAENTLSLDIIIDQWSNNNPLPAGYQITVYDGSFDSFGSPTTLATTQYNAALNYIDDPDYSTTECDRFYDNQEILTFTPTLGKITLEVKRISSGSTQQQVYIDNIKLKTNVTPLMDISYNDRGHRIKKTVYNLTTGASSSTYYLRDVSGSIMAIYTKSGGIATKNTPVIAEIPVYGAARIGVYNINSLSISGGTTGSYRYELTDHLGNVRAVIAKATNGTPIAITKADYYPGGMAMPNRNVQGDYRYGYQGEFSEKDEETGLNAFQLRMYDSRINRWISPDPMKQYHSPYMAMDNRWNMSTDPTGGCTDCSECPDACGQLGLESIPSGQSIDYNFDADSYFIQDGLDSSLLGQATVFGVSNKNVTPFQVGVDWLTGTGPRHRTFRDGDLFTEMLKTHEHVIETEQIIARKLRTGEKMYGYHNYSLGGVHGVGKYIRDYSTLTTGGATGNLAVTYLGSYTLNYTVTDIDMQNGTATIHFKVHNSSTIQSGLRPPVLGYTDWWKNGPGKSLNESFQTGPMSPTTQDLIWSTTIKF